MPTHTMLEEPKKKRRQNVACDACKHRRVKCDLAPLLQSIHAESVDWPDSSIAGDTNSSISANSPSPEDIPLADLVRQNPAVCCTNCKSKGLKCTTNQILNPSKPKKGGRRIDEARRKFGSDGGEISGGDAEPVGGPSSAPAGGTSGSAQVWPGLNPKIVEDFITTAPLQPSLFVQPPPGVSNSPLPEIFEPNSTTAVPDMISLLGFGPGSGMSFDPPALPAESLPTSTTDPNSTTIPPFLPPSAASNTPSINLSHPAKTSLDETQGSSPIWWPFSDRPGEMTEHVELAGRTPVAASPVPPPNKSGNGQFHGNTPLNHASAFLIGSYTKSIAEGLSSGQSPENQQIASNFLSLPSHGNAQSKKRSRGVSPSPTSAPDEKVLVRRKDPWQLYAKEEDSRIVRWGKKEAVQEKLADRALGIELSRHLVKTFFQAVHFSYPAILPESFYLEWMRAGQRSDRMTPAQEVLCSAIEAWGARYSDSPVVLGLPPEKAKTAPKVIQANGTFVPGTQARAHWGRARLAACKALLERTRTLIDNNGILRKPSITGVQALTLYMQLMLMTDDTVDAPTHYMEGHMIHNTITQQMQVLGLMWDSDQPIVTDSNELPMSLTQLKMKQRRLFWAHLVGDAFWAAASGNEPRVPKASMDAAGNWLLSVTHLLPESSFNALSFYLSCYYHITLIGRDIATSLSIPSKVKGAVDVVEFCGHVQRIWKDINAFDKDMNPQVTRLFTNCPRNDILAFSPLNYFSNLRLSSPFLLLLIHQLIREQLEFRKTLSSAYIAASQDRPDYDRASSDESSDEVRGVWTAAQSHVQILQDMSSQSVDMMLRSCRAQVGMFKALMPTGTIQTAMLLLRELIATAQFLAEVPTNEQGYPDDTPGGYDWTWEKKQEEMNCCIEALYQVGWAWADVADVLDKIMVTMERLTPTPAQLTAYKERVASRPPSQTPKMNEAARRREQEKKDDEAALKAVLSHWPPVSVPELIENAIGTGELDLENDQSVMRLTFFHNRLVDEMDSLTGSGQSHHSSPSTFASPEEASECGSSAQGGFGQDSTQKLRSFNSSSVNPSTAKALNDLFPHTWDRELLSDFDSSGRSPGDEQLYSVRTWFNNGKPEDGKRSGQSPKLTNENNTKGVGYGSVEPRTSLTGLMTPLDRAENEADLIVSDISIGGQTENLSKESSTSKDADEAQDELRKFFNEWGKDMGLEMNSGWMDY
ncbi:hypothetical protein CNAG_06136 [Cryptococcus neoformans var. grubii H99]|uniref:Xylanolytic transcriptional activator regulatory domain-containing protein n=1 Tax=Cryptococcus neoformans (strain H99 / ATCC 208821 / CBS 10515 / FGSC 9487) TaxID=235443 RepID=J9VV64_CRYN9|nr:hypothetical protein CNAG_06136 [Cryptococcus neoformans var. grubii H99]AFR98362.2 hypothetical protein CNAG_06136 [Cryptococcus neoformans var. grubii H99]AUB28499.1 hypothetical protein CKF44_06136 [Cryptococcus neoformans var. grubii]|eukprot:XP_012053017.1 hypothetical protein CNAG_06136 [Cryptococcus neoformans var. grubii H99]